EGLAAFLGGGLGIAGYHGQALFGAGVDAAAALDAVKALNGPGAGGPVHLQRTGRAAAGAQAAADAVFDLDLHMPAHAVGVVGRFKGVTRGGGFAEQVFEHRARKRESPPGVGLGFVLALFHGAHLSVQLMQGSMVRISRATSASWQPLSSSSMGGMLLVVGVRRRKRSRYLVPLALT